MYREIASLYKLYLMWILVTYPFLTLSWLAPLRLEGRNWHTSSDHPLLTPILVYTHRPSPLVFSGLLRNHFLHSSLLDILLEHLVDFGFSVDALPVVVG